MLTAYEVTRDSLVYFGTDTVRYLYMHGRLRKEPVMHRRGAYIMRPICGIPEAPSVYDALTRLRLHYGDGDTSRG